MTASAPCRGGVIWITGLPAAGKTTFATALYDCLRQRGRPVLWLDSDDLRRVMTPNPTYSAQERDVFYGALGHVAQRAADGGVLAIVSATAPKRSYRDSVRKKVERFVEIWLTCPYEVLRERDKKGLYRRYEAGEISNLPGRGAAYEEPKDPHLTFASNDMSTKQMSEKTMSYLADREMV